MSGDVTKGYGYRMRFLIPLARALMASAMVLITSFGAGPWLLCLGAEGYLPLKSHDTDRSSFCTSDGSGNNAVRPDASGELGGEPCWADFSLPSSSFDIRRPRPDLAWSFLALATTPPIRVLTHTEHLPLSGLFGASGPSGPLVAHQTVVLRL